jgi:hypothetical protein
VLEPGLKVAGAGVALLIMWRTSELIIWRSCSESRVKCTCRANFCGNSRFQTFLSVPARLPRTIVCQIIRTRMCQIISKTTPCNNHLSHLPRHPVTRLSLPPWPSRESPVANSSSKLSQ